MNLIFGKYNMMKVYNLRSWKKRSNERDTPGMMIPPSRIERAKEDLSVRAIMFHRIVQVLSYREGCWGA